MAYEVKELSRMLLPKEYKTALREAKEEGITRLDRAN